MLIIGEREYGELADAVEDDWHGVEFMDDAAKAEAAVDSVFRVLADRHGIAVDRFGWLT